MTVTRTVPNIQNWLGRTETRSDVFTPVHHATLSALLDHPVEKAETVPALGHWVTFVPATEQSALGIDGHQERGDFLPPVELPRRMWASGRVTWYHPIGLGEEVTRRTSIEAIDEKSGRTGPLVFLTLRHDISVATTLAASEIQQIVFRDIAPYTAPAVVSAPPHGDLEETVVPDEVLLFRWSAATFNAHRIHYDRDYTRDVEGYPDLVVQGPLTATLLLDLVRRNRPDVDITAFEFRARIPAFVNERLRLSGVARPGGYELAAIGPHGHTCMSARVEIR